MRKTISAFTIISNSIKYDFPIVQSINSVIDAVDEYVINIDSNCKDGTNELMRTFFDDPKIKIIENDWEGKEHGTLFLSSQTNKALNECSKDWCLYLQADEVIDEKDIFRMHKWIDRAEREGAIGITFQYLHFIKDPMHIRKTYRDGKEFDAYDKEVRLIKNNGQLVSFGDAQSFCNLQDLLDIRGPQPIMHRKELLIDSDMEIFHYGYLRDGKTLLEKKKYLDEFYNISEPARNEQIKEQNDEYVFDESSIKEYTGEHPEVMLSKLSKYK